MKSSVRKVSVVINKQKTSISLEPEFLAEIKRIAVERKIGLFRLIEWIQAEGRPYGNLSSRCRLFVLHDLKMRAGMAA